MRAGELADRVTIQARTESADTHGAAGADSWANIATAPVVWAAIEPLQGSEAFEAERLQGQVTYRVRLRYRADWPSVLTPKHRLRYGTRVFDIQSVLEVVRRRELHVMAMERV